MSTPFESTNPYVSPAIPNYGQSFQREVAPPSVMAAGTALMVVAALGLAISAFNFVKSFGAAHIDPNAPEFVQQIQQGAVGPVATAIQGGFVLFNLFIIACGFQMIRLQSWGLAVTGSVLAMLNIGSCCCVLGAPIGIWSLTVLMSPDVISIFTAAKAQQ
jgi:hypothetical protein